MGHYEFWESSGCAHLGASGTSREPFCIDLQDAGHILMEPWTLYLANCKGKPLRLRFGKEYKEHPDEAHSTNLIHIFFLSAFVLLEMHFQAGLGHLPVLDLLCAGDLVKFEI